MEQSNLLSTITCVNTERSIEAGELKIINSEYDLQLYEDVLVSSTATLSLENVWDISYKTFSDDANLLYLHTHKGVLTYKVPGDPQRFVNTFKKIKNVHY
ncbi:hypothetical protein [Planococcus sp. CAU13]|uniref:hypothetical protein n=1 Tax=Planococcus sp. CAU13 TaxID=1541197 RepID=UPI00052FF864|nr:hypothetical protein [Planococcus sp. CAU13]